MFFNRKNLESESESRNMPKIARVLIKTEIKNCVLHFFNPLSLSHCLKIVFIYIFELFSFSVFLFFSFSFTVAIAVALALAAVVNCNLKNITANCQNALTFTNYFAGSSQWGVR